MRVGRGRPPLSAAETERRERIAKLYGFWTAGVARGARGRRGLFMPGDFRFTEREFLTRYGHYLIGRPVRRVADMTAAKKALQRARGIARQSQARDRWREQVRNTLARMRAKTSD